MEAETVKTGVETACEERMESCAKQCGRPTRSSRSRSAGSWLWSLFRFRRVKFSAARESSTGDDTAQIWSLQPHHGSLLPTGPTYLSARVTAGTLPVTACIQYRCGDDFEEAALGWVHFDAPSIRTRFIHLPAELSELRLVAYTSDSSFKIVDLQLREVGRLQRALRKLSSVVLPLLRNPGALATKVRKAFALYRRGGLQAIRQRLLPADRYPEWVQKYDTLSDDDRRQIEADIDRFSYRPCISVVLPVYNVPERFLRAAIESVRRQLYKNWELCIADDNSPSPHVQRVIREYAALDARIKFVLRSENGHIAEATNSAAALASGEFVGFLDHDDELREHALYMVLQELQSHPDADLIYSDEDKITEDGERFYPHFKPDWNLELLLCQNYICHFTVVRSSLFRALGGIRKGFDGAQDWDLVLRTSEHTTVDKIRHIPHILYHWRVLEGSTAKGADAKPYVTEAQARTVSEYLVRNGAPDARVVSIPSLSMLRVHYPVCEPGPLVSVIVPTYNQLPLLSKCLDGLLDGTSYSNVEVIVVDNRSDDPATLEYLERLRSDSRVRVVRDDGPFNFARLNNEAVRVCKGSLIAFLNNDIEVVNPDWLHEMVARLRRPGVAAVGAKLLYPNGTIQHAGVLLGASGGVADHMLKHHSAHELGYFCRAVLPQNVSAVTAACMLVSREAFERVNGFDEKAFAVAYNDIDLCLRLRQAGYLIVYTPYAELIHHESVSRGYEDSPEKRARFEGEVAKMHERWGDLLRADPYYNPNFSLDRADFTLAMPRRLHMPWS